MSHQDKDRCPVVYNVEYLRQALHWLLGPVDWCLIAFRADCTWQPLQLAVAALLWAWSDELTLGERFFASRRIAQELYQPQQEFAASYQAFFKMLVRWTDAAGVALAVRAGCHWLASAELLTQPSHCSAGRKLQFDRRRSG